MKKLILLLILCFASYTAYTQDVIMSKEKHEQLKKNIEDYRNLIKLHEQIKIDTANLKQDIARQALTIKILEQKLSECRPKKKNLFKKIGLWFRKIKIKPFKDKQNW